MKMMKTVTHILIIMARRLNQEARKEHSPIKGTPCFCKNKNTTRTEWEAEAVHWTGTELQHLSPTWQEEQMHQRWRNDKHSFTTCIKHLRNKYSRSVHFVDVIVHWALQCSLKWLRFIASVISVIVGCVDHISTKLLRSHCKLHVWFITENPLALVFIHDRKKKPSIVLVQAYVRL